MTAVSEDQHGTYTGYKYGCRCSECKRAQSASAGHHNQDECVAPFGRISTCAQIAHLLVQSEHDVRRVARVANKSERHFAKYSDELAQVKEKRATVVRRRDEHMAECPAAVDRFGVSA